MTDPLRDGHDGPMIHIIRHYKPEKVYFFLTEEMSEIENSDRRFSQAVNKLGFNCEIKKIETGIKDPSDFDAFINIMPDVLDQVVKENPGCEILANVTSGTAQIMSALCLLIASGKYNIKPIQVKTHKGRSNMDKSRLNFDLDEHIQKLEDQKPGGLPSRCHEPPIVNFKKALLSSQIKSVIQQYDYSAALTLLKPHQMLFSGYSSLYRLIEFAGLRINLQSNAASELFKTFENELSLQFIGDDRERGIIEYYYSLQVKYKRRELSDFMLRITPFITAVLKYFIEQFIPLSSICCLNDKNIEIISRERIEKLSPQLLAVLDSQTGGLKENFLNNYILIKILAQLPKAADCKDRIMIDLGKYNKIVKLFNKFNELEQKVRNKIAHELKLVTEEEIRAKLGESSDKIMNNIRKLVSSIFQEKTNEQLFIYDEINNLIIKRLE
jgi:CRISPR type III-A/MTUBE-associated protein Csm6